MQSIQCGGSSFLLRYFPTLFCLIPTWCLSMSVWLSVTLFLMKGRTYDLYSIQPRTYFSSDNIFNSSWPNPFHKPLSCRPPSSLPVLGLLNVLGHGPRPNNHIWAFYPYKHCSLIFKCGSYWIYNFSLLQENNDNWVNMIKDLFIFYSTFQLKRVLK